MYLGRIEIATLVTVYLIYRYNLLWIVPKHKTSILIEKGLWIDWIKFVVERTGNSRRLSEEIQKALEEYMLNHTSKTDLCREET